MQHHNQLSPAEAERLALLAEECGEVIQIVGKILRHGYESYDPTKPQSPRVTNRDLLACELGDFEAALQLLINSGDVTSQNVVAAMVSKQRRVCRYLHHQNTQGGHRVVAPMPDSLR
jgi:hypothetical protein